MKEKNVEIIFYSRKLISEHLRLLFGFYEGKLPNAYLGHFPTPGKILNMKKI